jgi:hypothetical protein
MNTTRGRPTLARSDEERYREGLAWAKKAGEFREPIADLLEKQAEWRRQKAIELEALPYETYDVLLNKNSCLALTNAAKFIRGLPDEDSGFSGFPQSAFLLGEEDPRVFVSGAWLTARMYWFTPLKPPESDDRGEFWKLLGRLQWAAIESYGRSPSEVARLLSGETFGAEMAELEMQWFENRPQEEGAGDA